MFNEPEGGNGGSLTLTVEDVSCTEAWIKLSASGTELPASVKLYANDTLKQTLELTTADTLIYDEGLLPNRTYAYRAELIKPQKPTVKSQTVTATTLDTTSHDFTWETFTFGGANGSSYLRDVAIINENDIWAVGEIHTEDDFDSLGHYQPYNAVHWNGEEWELRRVMFYIDPDQPWAGKTSSPCETIFFFGGNSFAITSNVQIAIFDESGNYQILKMGFPWEERFTINAMWGTSSSDFYVVGNNGNIAHYDGSGWEKIESGTELDIQDIYGIEKNGEEIIACAITNIATAGNGEILLFRNGRKQTIFWPSGLRINSIWYKTERQMFACGDGIYKRIGINWERQIPFENTTYTEKVRGNDINDLFVGGDFGFLAHYNGLSWKVYDTGNVALFYSLSVKGDLVVGVGERNAKGVVYLGRRN